MVSIGACSVYCPGCGVIDHTNGVASCVTGPYERCRLSGSTSTGSVVPYSKSSGHPSRRQQQSTDGRHLQIRHRFNIPAVPCSNSGVPGDMGYAGHACPRPSCQPTTQQGFGMRRSSSTRPLRTYVLRGKFYTNRTIGFQTRTLTYSTSSGTFLRENESIDHWRLR